MLDETQTQSNLSKRHERRAVASCVTCAARSDAPTGTSLAARHFGRDFLRSTNRLSVALPAKDLPELENRLLVFLALAEKRVPSGRMWDTVLVALQIQVRVAQHRDGLPTVAVIDSQSAKTTEKGGLVAMMATKK